MRAYHGELACPHCGASQSSVTNTYGNRAGDCINRRRECRACRKRFTSHERLPDTQLKAQVDRLLVEVERLRRMLREHVPA